MKPQISLRTALIGLGVLALVGMLLPASLASGEVAYDVTVRAGVEWRSITNEWVLHEPGVAKARESRVMNPFAWYQNSLFFAGEEDESKRVEFTLRETSGAVLQTEHDTTGDGDSFQTGVDAYPSVVFRKVTPGTYEVRVRILDEAGHALADTRTTITINGEVN